MVKYSYITKSDIERQLGNATDLVNLNATKIDSLLGLIASFVKKVAPAGITYSIAKAAAEVEVQFLKSVLAECSSYDNWAITVISTYEFSGWGTGTSNPGYPTYKLDTVEYSFSHS